MKIYVYMIAFILVATAGTALAAEAKSVPIKTITSDSVHETLASEVMVGSVKTVSGDVSIVRKNKTFKVKVGTTLFLHDTISTGGDGAVGMTFKDNGVLSIGPESKLVISDFAFNPERNKFSMITDVLNGSCVYLGGLIAKLKPKSVLFNTPAATIGIRGTYFAVNVGSNWQLFQ